MSRATRPSFDVFLAHDPSDNALATAVIDRFTAAELTAFSPLLSEEQPLDPTSEVVRRELRDSFSFVVLLTPAFAVSETLPFLIGAAGMAGSPIHVLTSDDDLRAGMTYLGRYPVVPLWDGVERLVRQVRAAAAPFPDDQADALRTAYSRVGATADQVLGTPSLRTRLSQEFRALSGADVPEPRVVRELIRLRKQRKLPRLALAS